MKKFEENISEIENNNKKSTTKNSKSKRTSNTKTATATTIKSTSTTAKKTKVKKLLKKEKVDMVNKVEKPVKPIKALNASGNKIRLLRLWEILKKETDKDHPMSSVDLLERLHSEGLKCDRRTIYDDVDLLNEFGYEIMCNRKERNEYYVEDRDFDVPEVQILMDAVQASSFITEKKTKILTDKLAQLAGSKRGEVLKKNIVEFSTVKGSNENIYYSVDAITSAIIKKKMVSFYYFEINENGEKVYHMQKKDPEKRMWYRMTPISTIFHDNNYYLIAYNDYFDKVSNYRIDRMDNVEIFEEKASEKVKDFDIAKYKKSMFGMYGGKTENIIVEADKSVIKAFYDKFGEAVNSRILNENTMIVEIDVQVGRPLLSWLIGFGCKVKVTTPKWVVDEIKSMIEESKEVYFSEEN